MLYATPPIRAAQAELVDRIDALRRELHDDVTTPTPWLGSLRRQTSARSIASSISIEGFSIDSGDALNLLRAGSPPSSPDRDRMAAAGYAHAMDRVGVLAGDPSFRWLDRVLLDLHFDACYFQREINPGRWRTGPISVTLSSGPPSFVGPPPELVVPLMDEVVAWLGAGDLESHPVVRAAMAHLHVVSVHPFGDGNGRLARIVQSLVLAREQILAPELGSIEDYLARHTADYYAVLREVQGGSYQPDRDATPWVEFCLTAHIDAAERHLERVEAAGRRWTALETLAAARGWPDRLVIAMEHALTGGVERRPYSEEAEVSPATATNDLRRLSDAGLVQLRGGGRSTSYIATPALEGHVKGSRGRPAGGSSAGEEP